MQKVTGDLSFQAVSHSAAFSEESLHQSTRRNCVSRRTPTRLVAMLHTVRYMLIDNDFVHVYSFDLILKGVPYGPACAADEQTGPAGVAGQHLLGRGLSR